MEPRERGQSAGQGCGHLGLSTRGVVGEQVASWRDLGFSPSEAGRPGSHFLGLQVLGALQPWEGKGEEKMKTRPFLAPSHFPTPVPHSSQEVPVMKVMLAGEVTLGPRRPCTVAV